MTTILVIEDETLVRANLLELLEAEGFEVVGAENGLLGVLGARARVPDLILCDILMPEIDGYDVLKALRQDLVTATIPFTHILHQAPEDGRKAIILNVKRIIGLHSVTGLLLDKNKPARSIQL